MYPSDRPHVQAFSAVVFLAFWIQMLSPFAFATPLPSSGQITSNSSSVSQDLVSASFASTSSAVSFAATATPVASSAVGGRTCSVSRQTADEVKKIWDSTLGFTGQEVNSLSDSALKANNPSSNSTNGQVVVNNYINSGASTSATDRVSVDKVAALLGKSVNEVANDFAVDPKNGSISMQMFQAEAEKNNALSGLLGSFSSLLGTSALSKVEAPAYTNYKIKLPNNKTLALSEVLSLEDINGKEESCLLDDS
ncbi:MAG: hypothetical protein WC408_02100, partial [Candidatus Micrarchaeia archaeon]